MHVDFRNRVRPESLEVGQERRLLITVRIEQCRLRHGGADLAGVVGAPPCTRAALERHATRDARVEIDFDTVPVAPLFPVHVRERLEVVGHSRERRRDVVHRGNGVSAAVRQTRVPGRDDAEGVVVRRGRRQVVDHEEVAEDAAEVTHVH